jgi:hypothetical protein
MRRQLFGYAVAALLSVATAAAHTSSQPTNGSQTDRSRASSGTPATVEGCLHREADVPGRRPNIAERAGIGEDYLLTQSRIVKGSGPSGETDEGGSSAIYDVQGLSVDQLKSNVNRRVQIDGTFAHEERAQKGPEVNGTGNDLVELNGTTIRSVSGDCATGPPVK